MYKYNLTKNEHGNLELAIDLPTSRYIMDDPLTDGAWVALVFDGYRIQPDKNVKFRINTNVDEYRWLAREKEKVRNSSTWALTPTLFFT